MPPVGQYRPNYEFGTVKNGKVYAVFGGKKESQPRDLGDRRTSCQSQSNIEGSHCNVHSRRVVKIKDMQAEEKGRLLAAIMADSNTLFDGVDGLEKEKEMKKLKK